MVLTFQLVKKALIFHQTSIDVMKFGNTNCSCFPYIGIFIFQAFPQGLAKILGDFVDTNTTHCPNS